MHTAIMLFTPETARSASQKGLIVRMSHSKARQDREALLTRLIEQASFQPPIKRPDDQDSYATEQVVIVREQLARLHDQLRKADDTRDTFRIATAICKLGDYEADLAGRPRPGNLRPVAPRRAVAAFTPPADS